MRPHFLRIVVVWLDSKLAASGQPGHCDRWHASRQQQIRACLRALAMLEAALSLVADWTKHCVAEPPKILHYGLLWEVNEPGKYSFDKHWHYEFQATRCPPWDLEGEHTDAKGGLFPHPPRASSFNTSVWFDCGPDKKFHANFRGGLSVPSCASYCSTYWLKPASPPAFAERSQEFVKV